MSKLGTTKKDFNKVFNELRKWGYTVLNFSDKRALRRGMKDWVDYVIFGRGMLVFVELKIGEDKVSKGQAETAIKLAMVTSLNKTVFYNQVKELKDAKNIVDYLLMVKNG